MNGMISNLSEIAYLRRYTLASGKETGVEVIECDNGKIRFTLNVSCALDVMQLWHCGTNVSFISKNGFSVKHTDFPSRFEGGMLYTCGLDNIGGRVGYETHGTFHEKYSTVTRTECSEDGICVEGYIRDTELFGKNLLVKRRIYTEIGSESVTLEDTIVNEGARVENYCVLYHVNVGYPMIDDGARIEADVKFCEPRTEYADNCLATAFVTEAPLPCREETCYYLTLAEKRVSVVNEKLGKKFTLSYSGDDLTNFIEWKSMAIGDYALGLEPCTSLLDDKFSYKAIPIGEKRVNSLTLTVNAV